MYDVICGAAASRILEHYTRNPQAEEAAPAPPTSHLLKRKTIQVGYVLHDTSYRVSKYPGYRANFHVNFCTST